MKKKAIAHNILGALSNFVFLFLTSILLLPYYFKYISASEYGIWLGGVSFLSLVSVFEANISFILTQQLVDKWYNKKTTEFSKYLSAAMLFGLFVSFFIVISTYFFKDTLALWVSPDTKINQLFSDSFFLYAISLSFTIISGYINSVSQVFLKTLLPPLFNLIASVLGIVYTVWAVPTQGIFAIAAGNLIKSFVFMLLTSLYSLKILKAAKIPFLYDVRYLYKLILNIGFPFLSKVGMTLAVSIQNFIIATSISASATTVFDITKKLPAMTVMIINMMAVSTFTSFSLFYAENSNSGTIHHYTKFYFSLIKILLLFSLAGVFLIGQDFVSIWVGEDKFGGDLLLALICLTVLTDQLRMILGQQYYAIGKFNLTSITDTIFAISFLILAVLIMPVLGLNGIVLAGLAANIIYFLCCFVIEKKIKVDMVLHIINKSFFVNLCIVLLVVAVAKFIITLYSHNYLIFGLTLFLSIVVLSAVFFFKEKALFNFLLSKFTKSPKV